MMRTGWANVGLWAVALGILGAASACSPGATSSVDGDATVTRADTSTTSATSPDSVASTDGTSSTTHDTTAPDTAVPPVTELDPNCLDGQYDETVQDQTPSISALVSGYSPAGMHQFVDQVLGLRYPLGQRIVQQALVKGASMGNCIDMFVSDSSTASAVIGSLSTVVHECGHILDNGLSDFGSRVYRINDDLDFSCQRPSATFARSLINQDAYSHLRPDDSYKDVYLDGDPNDQTFDSGDQGYDMVLEEATQYVNSLATDWTLRDAHGPWSISAKDGILTFLWYIERYLHLGRLEHPEAYNAIVQNKCWREATLTVWGRAWLYLGLAEDQGNLGLDDAAIRPLVMDADLLGEIQRLRDAAGCN